MDGSSSQNHYCQDYLDPFDTNDPYRIRKNHQRSLDDDGTDNSHSRSASDSSQKPLSSHPSPPAKSEPHRSLGWSYHDDPYAPRLAGKSGPTRDELLASGRANSYLPYSHHARSLVVQGNTSSLYIEDDKSIQQSASKECGGLVSMLHDTFADVETPQRNSTAQPSATTPIPDLASKRKRPRRFCGLKLWTWAAMTLLLLVAIVLVWFFVWPRVPGFQIADMDMQNTTWLTNSTKGVTGTANVKLTVDNTYNWVPTRISNLAMSVSDSRTRAKLGQGNSGSLVLAPRLSQTVNVPVPIGYMTTSANDATWENLYNACGVQVHDPSPSSGSQQQNLYIAFDIEVRIAGIAWPYFVHIESSNGLECASLL